MKKLNSKGVALVETVILVVVVAAIAGVGAYVLGKGHAQSPSNSGGTQHFTGATGTISVDPASSLKWGGSAKLDYNSSLGNTWLAVQTFCTQGTSSADVVNATLAGKQYQTVFGAPLQIMSGSPAVFPLDGTISSWPRSSYGPNTTEPATCVAWLYAYDSKGNWNTLTDVNYTIAIQ